ncbi:MAG: alpha/beta hydrolase [Candidatus Bathyarchaeota archaeon]|nr:MAG: alpha/beta hydrolase [Candidatus Bathyarchaeota archaeon]
MRRRSKIILSFLLIVTVLLVGFVIWAETPLGPMSEAYEALQSNSAVIVSTERWLLFRPTSSNASKGFILYPGGRVDSRSYAPAAHAIAAEGYLCVIVPMPLNLAVFGVNIANDVKNAYPQVSSWAIGGHSLGGTMAAQFAYENPSKIQGLVLWAAYPATGSNLSKYSLLVTTIHGTNDGLVSNTQINTSLKLLPPNTVRVEIDGGNHAQFGWYGEQPGDTAATITRSQQQSQIINATVQLLRNL